MIFRCSVQLCYGSNQDKSNVGQRAIEFKNKISSYGNTSFVCFYNGSGIVVLNRLYSISGVVNAFFWPLLFYVVEIALYIYCCRRKGCCCCSATTGRSDARPVVLFRNERSAATGPSNARPVQGFYIQLHSIVIDLDDVEMESVEAARRTDDRPRTSNIFSIDACLPPLSYVTTMAMAQPNLGSDVRFNIDRQHGLM